MTAEATSEQRKERLLELLRVAKLHAAALTEPVKLNGEHRVLNMHLWDCGTGACLLGSYCLTPFGKQYYRLIKGESTNQLQPELIDSKFNNIINDAATHFGIDSNEAEFLFYPEHYNFDECILPHDFDPETDYYDDLPIDPSAVVEHVETVLYNYISRP